MVSKEQVIIFSVVLFYQTNAKNI